MLFWRLWQKNADDTVHRIMKNTAIEAYQEQADLFVDLHTAAQRMKGKKIISGEFVSRELGWFRAAFVSIETDLEKKPVKMIFTIQSIDNEKRKEEKLLHTSMRILSSAAIIEGLMKKIYWRCLRRKNSFTFPWMHGCQ